MQSSETYVSVPRDSYIAAKIVVKKSTLFKKLKFS